MRCAQKLAHLLRCRRLARAWIAQKQQMPNAGVARLPRDEIKLAGNFSAVQQPRRESMRRAPRTSLMHVETRCVSLST